MLESLLGFAPTSTVLPGDVIDTAHAICHNLLSSETRHVNPEVPCDLPDLVWGRSYSEKVDRLCALFYRLTVEEAHVQSGFAICCESLNKDKFKLAVFDASGAMLEEDECARARSGKCTSSALYFNCVTTYRLGDNHNHHNNNNVAQNQSGISDKEPQVLSRLNYFVPCNKVVRPGPLLVLVYGDNLFGKTSFRLSAVPFACSLTQMETIGTSDAAVLGLKEKIDALKQEYLETKKAYFKCVEKIQGVSVELEQALDLRESTYRKVIDVSVQVWNSGESKHSDKIDVVPKRKHQVLTQTIVKTSANLRPVSVSAPPQVIKVPEATSTSTSPNSPNAQSQSAPPQLTPQSSFASMTNTASAAGGWFTKTLSSGFNQLQTIVISNPKKPNEVPQANQPKAQNIAVSVPSSQIKQETQTKNEDIPVEDFDQAAAKLFDQIKVNNENIPEPNVTEHLKHVEDPDKQSEMRVIYDEVMTTPVKNRGGFNNEDIHDFQSEAANLLTNVLTSSRENSIVAPVEEIKKDETETEDVVDKKVDKKDENEESATEKEEVIQKEEIIEKEDGEDEKEEKEEVETDASASGIEKKNKKNKNRKNKK